jgi:DNA-directed RNA polymerase specialized sigma54-like protein
MADDVKDQIKLAQQLTMTPQLQLAIRLLSTPSGDLNAMLDDLHGLESTTGHVDPLLEASDEERAVAAEEGTPVWEFELPRPPGFTAGADVWIHGDPPIARACREALPHMRLAEHASPDDAQKAAWFIRGLRQRAKTYERLVGALLASRPNLATIDDPQHFIPVPLRELAEATGLHESTITRAAAGCRIETPPHHVFLLTSSKHGIGIARE